MRCNSKLSSILFKALRNLRNRSLIERNTQIMIVFPATKGKFSHHYVANADEIKNRLTCLCPRHKIRIQEIRKRKQTLLLSE